MSVREQFFEKCGCGNDTFKVRMTPMAKFASDTDWICTECGEVVGGIYSDPMNELHFSEVSESIEKGEDENE